MYDNILSSSEHHRPQRTRRRRRRRVLPGANDGLLLKPKAQTAVLRRCRGRRLSAAARGRVQCALVRPSAAAATEPNTFFLTVFPNFFPQITHHDAGIACRSSSFSSSFAGFHRVLAKRMIYYEIK